jgi:hypothetical protein
MLSARTKILSIHGHRPEKGNLSVSIMGEQVCLPSCIIAVQYLANKNQTAYVTYLTIGFILKTA